MVEGQQKPICKEDRIPRFTRWVSPDGVYYAWWTNWHTEENGTPKPEWNHDSFQNGHDVSRPVVNAGGRTGERMTGRKGREGWQQACLLLDVVFDHALFRLLCLLHLISVDSSLIHSHPVCFRAILSFLISHTSAPPIFISDKHATTNPLLHGDQHSCQQCCAPQHPDKQNKIPQLDWHSITTMS